MPRFSVLTANEGVRSWRPAATNSQGHGYLVVYSQPPQRTETALPGVCKGDGQAGGRAPLKNNPWRPPAI